MTAISRLRFAHLAWFSRPKGERWLWRHMRRHQVARIVQLGVGDARHARLLIEVAQRFAPHGHVQYTGVDLFEAGPFEAGQFQAKLVEAEAPVEAETFETGAAHAGLTLKETHCRLTATGGEIRLVPGNPLTALRRVANNLSGTQLLLISANTDEAALEQAWFYVPRMLNTDSLVLRERRLPDDQVEWQRVERSQIESLARSAAPRRAA